MVLQKAAQYEVIREGSDSILRIDFSQTFVIPSIEDRPEVMERIIEILGQESGITKIVLFQRRDYEYDYAQTVILQEIAILFWELSKEGINFAELGDPSCPTYQDCINKRYAAVQGVIYRLLKSDPIGAYVELRRMVRRQIIYYEDAPPKQKPCIERYSEFLRRILAKLANTRMITFARPYIAGYKIGDRSSYRKIFSPLVKPDFMYTKLVSAYPKGAEELANYAVGNTEVSIFSLPNSIQTLYHITPPEFKLSEDKYEILDQARKILGEHKPKESEFTDPERIRIVFTNVGADLIESLAEQMGISLKRKEVLELSQILVRYTVGFGLIEVMLEDPNVQDITINSPLGQSPMFIVHDKFADCITNVIPTHVEAESWASKLRIISGRPLDEANPILDTQLELPQFRARVAAITAPLNPTGLAYAFRRHREKPWTLPLFVKNKMINALGAGIMSFIIDGSRTLLVAGTRSSGKTSFLSSLMVEIMRRSRVITIEDTLELPVKSLREIGYNIQQMKVAAALTRGTTEVSASEGLRTTLRLGDSSLIVGEVRSEEARALYEAMRVGALANVVAGTIHGDSPYGVFDRVVNDLGVPRTSFKATDLVVVANPVRSPEGVSRLRRITQITEVRKHWEEDPEREGGFVDLMRYDAKLDTQVPSDELINGDSEVLKSIAGKVKDWVGNWDAVWENIELRAKIKQHLVDFADQTGNYDLLEASFVVVANDEFRRLSGEVREEVGTMDSERIFFEWKEWLKRRYKKMMM